MLPLVYGPDTPKTYPLQISSNKLTPTDPDPDLPNLKEEVIPFGSFPAVRSNTCTKELKEAAKSFGTCMSSTPFTLPDHSSGDPGCESPSPPLLKVVKSATAWI